jgi:fructose-1,6-bisphosphatase I
MNALQISTKIIQREINKAGFVGLHGIVDSTNSSGDTQKKLDVLSNEVMIEHLTHSRSCSYLLSEENEDKILISPEYQGPYIVAFDPLDGSSNIDCNCCVGTIFSIFLDNGEEFQKGDSILCAGYILYGPATEMVISFGKNTGVYRFVLDSSIGEYICIGKIQMPSSPKLIYSINEANHLLWDSSMFQWIQQYKCMNTKYTQRYIGSMVADVHRTLLYGGVFCYPRDKKNINGKLRILYECFPMAFLVEEAGGMAITSTSSQRILDILPTHIHQKTPIALGSIQEINKLIQIL